MEPALVISAASALAYVSTGASGALPPYGSSEVTEPAHIFRVAVPTIELSAYPVEIEPQLERIMYSSMSRDFERRYAL